MSLATEGVLQSPSAERTGEGAPPEARSGPDAITVIGPAGGWQLVNVRELWQFRELLYFLIWRDVKVRYKQTLLGAAWAVLQPLLMMAVFSIVFARVAGSLPGGMPYPVFVFAGLLPWTFFAGAISSAGNSVVGSERLITRIYFPRLAVPFASVGAAMIDCAIAAGVLLLLMAWFGVPLSWSVLLAPLPMALITLAGLGAGTLLAALNVAFRDFKHVIPFLVQIWMFATPTVYLQPDPATFAGARQLLLANPMIGLVSAFRSLMLGTPLDWRSLAVSGGGAVLLFVAGCLYFRRVEDSFADVI